MRLYNLFQTHCGLTAWIRHFTERLQLKSDKLFIFSQKRGLKIQHCTANQNWKFRLRSNVTYSMSEFYVFCSWRPNKSQYIQKLKRNILLKTWHIELNCLLRKDWSNYSLPCSKYFMCSMQFIPNITAWIQNCCQNCKLKK